MEKNFIYHIRSAMNKKHLLITALLPIAFLVIYFATRRTPYKVAEILSGLEVSKKSKVEVFEDDWGITGDGISVIVFNLHKEVIRELSEQCITANYQKLPIKEVLPLYTIYNYINRLDALGYYRLVVDDNGMSYHIVVLDLNKNKLVVVNEIF